MDWTGPLAWISVATGTLGSARGGVEWRAGGAAAASASGSRKGSVVPSILRRQLFVSWVLLEHGGALLGVNSVQTEAGRELWVWGRVPPEGR